MFTAILPNNSPSVDLPSKQCFCSDDMDEPMRKGTATCNAECTGDAHQTCGGTNAISLYEYADEPVDYPLLGCFRDSKTHRVLSAAFIDSDKMTTKV